ncbi:CpXC domain-containing protein [Flavobacterium branchiophilum]|uniref:Uncharacterized protein n=1 Tax=Flavobacterium branchiophilum (strain FL-15) TaxID=1034807 RepID=G2Z0A7_FLABF|nr:hypothetical protein [Flavobacterium branchiophilum]CCB70853.1 Hypothetical protein FBFL15_2902 [Flavobacterium branchiophilum FL-15]
MEHIKCDSCNIEFNPSILQMDEIKKAANSGIERFIVYCPKCHSLVFVHPLVLLGMKVEKPKEIEDSRIFCCPITSCIGFVEKDYDANIYGCSECGTEWKNLKKINEDIDKIVQKYEYRKEVYKRKGKTWESIDLEEIPKDYYNKVQKEK